MPTRRRLLALSAAALAAPALPAAAQGARAPAPYPLPEHLLPRVVTVRRDLAPGEIHVVSQHHYLYLITAVGQAIRYGVAVGRAELVYRGKAYIGRMAEWPAWRPTDEMIARSPERYARYRDGMPGGPGNPLGARAIYLYENGRDTTVRIHGTIEPESIGRSVSNGCIRMRNEDVIDLYARVRIGMPVTVY
jgi:lipoprotein-anchoring transpeptidase ErfK/SrfK